MPTTSREFQYAAKQRLTTADFLLEHAYHLDATYLAGYAIECSLKALILESTPQGGRKKRLEEISVGSKMHNWEILGGILRDLGCEIPLKLSKKLRRFTWSTSLRYETGRVNTGEARGFLKAAREVCDWVEGQIP